MSSHVKIQLVMMSWLINCLLITWRFDYHLHVYRNCNLKNNLFWRLAESLLEAWNLQFENSKSNWHGFVYCFLKIGQHSICHIWLQVIKNILRIRLHFIVYAKCYFGKMRPSLAILDALKIHSWGWVDQFFDNVFIIMFNLQMRKYDLKIYFNWNDNFWIWLSTRNK